MSDLISTNKYRDWSRAVLTHQIESGLHRREGNAINNFANTLPPASVYSVSLCFHIILGFILPWK
jgi:predicted nuclease of restriction endonuclease-like (RecB) superfamily